MDRRTLLLAGTGLAAVAIYATLPALGSSKAVSEARPAADLAPRPGRLLVDIREPSEWKDTGVLPNARLHSWRSAEDFVAALGPEAAGADEILILCRSGNRSGKAARELADYLHREVVDVSGGMLRLAREGEARVVAPSARMGCSAC